MKIKLLSLIALTLTGITAFGMESYNKSTEKGAKSDAFVFVAPEYEHIVEGQDNTFHTIGANIPDTDFRYGYIQFRGGYKNDGDWTIDQLFVHPIARKKGIAKALFTQCMEVIKKHTCDEPTQLFINALPIVDKAVTCRELVAMYTKFME